jgi:DNA-binding transcriptional LysR family regulator
MNLNKNQMALLPALYVLLTERNVTKAAKLMNLTQPAMSKILTQLREQFDDPLLVRCAKQYQLTTRAEHIMVSLNELMPQLENVWRPQCLSLERVEGKINVAGTDMDLLTASSGLTKIMNLAKQLQVSLSSSHEYSIDDLLHSKIDFLFSAFDCDNNGLYRALWLQSDYVMVSNRQNKRAMNCKSLDDYLDLSHITFQLSNANQSAVDMALKKKNKQRNTALWVPTFFQAISFVKASQSEMVITMPRTFAQRLDDHAQLRISTIPFEMQSLKVYLYWHKRGHDDPLNHWVRTQLIQSV